MRHRSACAAGVLTVLEHSRREGDAVEAAASVLIMENRSRLVFFGMLVITLGCSSDSVMAPSSGPTTLPLPLSPSLAVGTYHSCVLATSGQAYCWGSNDYGATGGNDPRTRDSLPVAVSGGPFVALSTADFGSCALTPAGAVYCWGEVPQLDVAGTTTSFVPVLQPSAASTLVSVSAGYLYACGLDATGAAYCWGNNEYGQLGVGDTTARAQPTRVAGGLTFKSIGAAATQTCGLTTARAAYCWGLNEDGALGTGDPQDFVRSTPAAVAGALSFASLGVGADVSCGVTSDGSGYCWGSSFAGELGDGKGFTATTPVPVTGGVHFKSITPGRVDNTFQSTCGITTDGSAYCWGLNDHSQLGSTPQAFCPSVASTSTGLCNLSPTLVGGLGAVVAIDPGIDHTCAITTANQVVCWGNNTRGQLGDGTLTARSTPALVLGLPALQ